MGVQLRNQGLQVRVLPGVLIFKNHNALAHKDLERFRFESFLGFEPKGGQGEGNRGLAWRSY